MPEAMRAKVVFALVCLTLGCNWHSMERSFFREPVGTRVERFRRYDLRDQYKIFRFGLDRREPPNFELADPIAEKGEMVVPFLLEQLKGTPEDQTVDDIIVIFEAMARLKTYNVSRDAELMATLTSKVSEIKDEHRKGSASRALEHISSLR